MSKAGHLLNHVTSLGGRADFHTTQFLRYTAASSSTFLIDLTLLWIFTDFLHVQYLIAAGLSFCIAIPLNYVASRRWAFKGTKRHPTTGLLYFMMIAGVGLLLVVALMAVFVELLHINYLISRIVVAGFVGLWNFGMNKFVNLRVSGI
jgi:putative flippase GtrA